MHLYENVCKLLPFSSLIFYHRNAYTQIKMTYQKQAFSAPSCHHPHSSSNSPEATKLKTLAISSGIYHPISKYCIYTTISYYLFYMPSIEHEDNAYKPPSHTSLSLAFEIWSSQYMNCTLCLKLSHVVY